MLDKAEIWTAKQESHAQDIFVMLASFIHTKYYRRQIIKGFVNSDH